jgi:3-isopropylmalate dehydrogenase
MMLRYSLDLGADADLVERAVDRVLADGVRTADIATPGATKVSTSAMGDAVLTALDRLAA